MKLMRPDLTLDLGNGLHLRALVPDDAALLAEATSGKRGDPCGVLARRAPLAARRADVPGWRTGSGQ